MIAERLEDGSVKICCNNCGNYETIRKVDVIQTQLCRVCFRASTRTNKYRAYGDFFELPGEGPPLPGYEGVPAQFKSTEPSADVPFIETWNAES